MKTHNKENYEQSSVMNLDTNIANEILKNKINNTLKISYAIIKLFFTPVMQGWLNIHKSINVTQPLNRIKNKKHIII
jgi:hypothetical protein